MGRRAVLSDQVALPSEELRHGAYRCSCGWFSGRASYHTVVLEFLGRGARFEGGLEAWRSA